MQLYRWVLSKAGLIMFVAVLFSGCASKYTGPKNEHYYQSIWCDQQRGKMEYVLDDSTRVDCLTSEYAVEVDWAHKWAEGVGQAQYYARETRRKPGLLLIVDKGEERFVDRAKRSGEYSGLKVWTIKK